MHTLNTYFISAPLSALLTISAGLSLAMIFDFAGMRIFRYQDPVSRALYFFVGLLVLSWIIWIIGLLGIAQPYLFQIILAGLIGTSLYLLVSGSISTPAILSVKALKCRVPNSCIQLLTISTTLILSGYAFLSITVPTDADSLSYHLAFPVEILEKGNLWFNKDNLHFRMAGFGEMINVLGVANGCPQLGSFIQFLALLHFLSALTAGYSNSHKLSSTILVLSLPTLLFLLPGQKHQLTGILATSVCFLYTSRHNNLTIKQLILWIMPLLLAIGIKYSFLLSSFSLLLLFALKGAGRLPVLKALFILVSLTAIFLGPPLFFKMNYLGDPASPLFEWIKNNPDPVILKLHRYIKNYHDQEFYFPLGILVSISPGKISTILGITSIVFLFLPALFNSFKEEVISIIVLISLILIGGQVSSRFFMEPLLWTIPLFTTAFGKEPRFKFFTLLSGIQSVVILVSLGAGLFTLLPSIFTNESRKAVLIKSANGYAESIWIDQVLPKTARIATTSRSRAFLPRPYLPWEYLIFTSLDDSKEAEALRLKMTLEYKTEYLILPFHGFEKFKKLYAGKLVFGPKKFPLATRNYFNRYEYEMAIYKVKK